MQSSRLLFLVFSAVFGVSSQVWADEISVAVAANFTTPMRKIAPEFENATGHKVLASYGSTGKFYAQIRNGAPFEILLAADDENAGQALAKEGATVPAAGSLTPSANWCCGQPNLVSSTVPARC